MTVAIVQFVIAAVVIIIAGTILARCADAIAELTGMGRLLVGSILLAGATSLPELVVDINAIRLGLPDLAVGDLAGSCLFNLLILAILDLSHHSHGRMLSRMAAAHALSGTAGIAMLIVAAISILLSHRWSDTVGGIGIGCIVIFFTYLLVIRLIFCDQRLSAQRVEHAPKDAHPASQMTLSRACTRFAIATIMIVIAGPFMAESAGILAELTGLGSTFMGSTLVALSTSLPELVATLTAVRIGAFELAIGNIFGSNAFNMLLLLPLDAFAPGSLLANVSHTHAITCLCTVLITSVILMGQLYNAEKRILLLEPDATMVILLVFGTLGMIFLLR